MKSAPSLTALVVSYCFSFLLQPVRNCHPCQQVFKVQCKKPAKKNIFVFRFYVGLWNSRENGENAFLWQVASAWLSASATHRQTGWDLCHRGWSDDACATPQGRPRHELAWIWTDFLNEQRRATEGVGRGRAGRRVGGKRQPAQCSCKTQDKFAIVSMQKLLHRCIGAHARVHMHLLRRVWMHSQELLSTMHAQVCTLDRCCEHQPKHLLYARYRMCICDRYWDIYVHVYIRWTGSTIRQGDEHRAVGGKGKMPHEMLQQDSKSWPSGSRFWWNLEKYLSLDFDPGYRTVRAWRLPEVLADWTKPASHVIQVSAQLASTSGNRQARRVRFPGSKSRNKYFSGFHHISHVCAVCFI